MADNRNSSANRRLWERWFAARLAILSLFVLFPEGCYLFSRIADVLLNRDASLHTGRRFRNSEFRLTLCSYTGFDLS